MSKSSDSKSCGGCIVLFLCMIIVASIVVGSIGAAFYVTEKYDESVYKSTMCFVRNYTMVESSCSRQDCYSNGFSQSCATSYYACYILAYTVIYHTTDGRELESTTTATGGPGMQSVSIQLSWVAYLIKTWKSHFDYHFNSFSSLAQGGKYLFCSLYATIWKF